MGGYKEVDRLLSELADDLELARDTCESHVKALASLSGNLQALYEYLYKGDE